MAYEKVYSRINWENEPSTKSPINEENLNKMDFALNEIDNRTVELSGYESVVIDYSNQAKTSAQNAKNSEDNAVASASSAKTNSDLAKSYTVGTHGEVRENDDTDNAKYYYEQTKSFVTGSVTGIKGEAEKEFRDGNVIITKGNLGLEKVENKSAQEIISEIGNATESSDGLMSKEDKVNLDGISDNVSNLSALTQNIVGSDKYNTSKSYAVGEMCVSNNNVYKCILACSGVEPPNTTYWKEVSLSSLNTNLSNMKSLGNSIDFLGQTSFTCPNDGYIQTYLAPASSDYAYFVLSGGSYGVIRISTNGSPMSTFGLVKKGDILSIQTNNTAEGSYMKFIPLHKLAN